MREKRKRKKIEIDQAVWQLKYTVNWCKTEKLNNFGTNKHVWDYMVSFLIFFMFLLMFGS